MSTTAHTSNGGDGCNLTQYTIVKGGTACLFGTCQGATNWSALTADFLLVNLLASPRYSQVLCANFDRQDMGSCISKLVATWNKNKTAPTSTSNNVIPATWSKKLTIMQHLSIEADSESQFDVLVEQVKQLLVDTAEPSSPASLTSGVAAPKNVALVLYSVSELVLNVGFRATRDLLRTLTSLLQEHINSASSGASSSSAAALVPCIVLVVHESLHSAAALAQIQSLASVIVRVVPNSGTLASTVVAEIQTIRRSAATGKINESTEMFTCRDSLLAPLKPVTHFGADDAEDTTESDSAKDITALPTAEDGAAKVGAAKSSAASSGPKASHNQRLITFDSTDPEFDEDSDPDADLDL